MYRKMMAILLAAGLALGMTACGQKTSGEGVSGENQSTENKEQEVLHLWHYWNSELQQNLLQEMVDNYEKDLRIILLTVLFALRMFIKAV